MRLLTHTDKEEVAGSKLPVDLHMCVCMRVRVCVNGLSSTSTPPSPDDYLSTPFTLTAVSTLKSSLER